MEKQELSKKGVKKPVKQYMTISNSQVVTYLQYASVIVIGLSFITTLMLNYFGNKANIEKDIIIANINQKVEEEKGKRVESEKTIANINQKVEVEKGKRVEAERIIANINLKVEEETFKRIQAETRLEELRSRVAWRNFNKDIFMNILKNKAKGKAEIVFLKDDSEAYSFAENIWANLLAAGWSVSKPTTEMNKEKSDRPFPMREGGIITSNFPSLIISVADLDNIKAPYTDNIPLSALMLAFTSCGIEPLLTIPYDQIRPQKGTIRIIVGSRL